MKKIYLVLCLLLSLYYQNSVAQSKSSLQGKIISREGTPLSGASVNVRFNNQVAGGAASDDAGNFIVSNLETGKNYLVEVSLVGHQTIARQIAINSGSNQVTLVLTPSATGMQEVVVTALGIKRAERNLGYAVTQLKSEEIATNKTINIQSALAGKVAGVDIGESANGLAGSKRVVIRGISTISTSGNSSPLWVIDGVPISSSNFGRNNDAGGGIDYGDGLSMLNPDNIESISVLKGNAAAALYGSRASNGVILVTTKTGKSSRKDLVVELNSSLTNSRIVDMTNWQYEYGQGRDGKRPVSQQEALVVGASSWGEKLDGKPTVQFDGVERPYVAQKNNPRNFYSDALLYTNTLSLSKNTDNHNYRLSVGQTDSKDFVPSGVYKKRNASLNASTRFGKATATVNSMYMIEKVKNRQNIGGNVHNAHYTLIHLPTNLNVLDLKPGYLPGGSEKIFTEGAITNPYFVIDRMYEEDTKNRLVNSLGLRYDILD
ncbi:MAG: TonB-dependent receptor plug domain-containing protein, partial [Flavisolibacter sp.]|nr:TonB-dependent receptor plug domain-containing protein [Flavisolibacter sp.]